MKNEVLKVVTPSDQATVDSLMTVGFAHCPLLRWLYPDPGQYLQHIHDFVKFYCGDALKLESGVCFPTSKKGVLLYLKSEDHREEDQLMSFLCSSVADTRRDEVVEVFENFEKYHPKEPFWYFTMIAVDPINWRSRAGTELLTYGAEQLDRTGAYAYAEITNKQCLRICERLGWELIEEVQIGSCPPMYPVIRAPQ